MARGDLLVAGVLADDQEDVAEARHRGRGRRRHDRGRDEQRGGEKGTGRAAAGAAQGHLCAEHPPDALNGA